MGVTAYNWRLRSNIYHTQIYPCLYTPQGGTTQDPDIMYPGYMNGFSPAALFTATELQLTAGVYDSQPYLDYQHISGNMSGFSSGTWHTKSHIIASDNSTYAVAVAIICFNTTLGAPTNYAMACYVYTNQTGGEWVGGQCGRPVSKIITEDYATVLNKWPEYMYLAMRYNANDYPSLGGVYWTMDNITAFSENGGFSDYLIPALRSAGSSSEENPDPQPTPLPNDDPYQPGGTSWTGGGGGSYDDDTDTQGLPSLPTLSAASTGFLTLFNPSAAQMRSLASYMWSGLFDIDTFRKLFADPMQCILGLSIVPVNVPSGGTQTVKVGNIDTGVSMTTASSQYVEVSCGNVQIDEYWGSYLDYAPYTKMDLYLPYCGIHPLNPDDVMGKSVGVTYHVDILSGACVAYVTVGGNVLYSYVGQCSVSIPITGNDWTNVINGALTIAGSVGSMVATGGASAPLALGAIASTAVNSMKPEVEKSGSMSGAGGLMAVQTPYIIITRPRQAIPARQNSFMGYPAFITEQLGNISGYTEVESIHLEGIRGTSQELEEIESLLKSGVIL